MAGSYGHLEPPDGGIGLLEDSGDKAEALHELYWLVNRLATQKKINNLLEREYYPMRRGDIPDDKAMKEVKRAFRE